MSNGTEKRPFPRHRYKSLFNALLVTIAADVLLSCAVIFWFKGHPDLIVFQGGTIPALIVINLGLAVACRFAAPRFYLLFLINSILSAMLFCLVYRIL
jgi:hypothetical protein